MCHSKYKANTSVPTVTHLKKLIIKTILEVLVPLSVSLPLCPEKNQYPML